MAEGLLETVAASARVLYVFWLKLSREPQATHKIGKMTFFVREINRFKVGVQRDSPFLHYLKDFKCCYHSQGTIETPTVGYRVQV